LPDDYQNEVLEKLNEDFDKLSKSDRFYHLVEVNGWDEEEKIIEAIIRSYKHNS